MKYLKTFEGFFGDGYETTYLAPRFPIPAVDKDFIKPKIVEGKLLDKQRINNRYYLVLEIDGDPETIEVEVKDFINNEIGDDIQIKNPLS